MTVRAFRPAAERWSPCPRARRPVELAAATRRASSRARSPAPSCRCATSSRSTTATAAHVTDRDPYAFLPTLGDLDLHLAGEGRHEELYQRLGAHVRELDGVHGTAFAVWAPAARGVSVVGDFNSWDGRLHPMRSLGSSGIWELFVPERGDGRALQVRDPRRRTASCT